MIRYARYFALTLVPVAGVFTLGFLFGTTVPQAQAHPDSECPVCMCECTVQSTWPTFVEEDPIFPFLVEVEDPQPVMMTVESHPAILLPPEPAPSPKPEPKGPTKEAIKKALDAIDAADKAEDKAEEVREQRMKAPVGPAK